MPMAVIASVDRVMQHILKRLPIGTMPLQLPPVGSVVRPNRQADAVMHQVAQQPVQAPLAVELVEDEPHDALRLLVRVEGEPAPGYAHIADRRVIKQLPPACFMQPPLVHAPAQEVEFGFTHDALERCCIIHIYSTFAEHGLLSSSATAEWSAVSLPP